MRRKSLPVTGQDKPPSCLRQGRRRVKVFGQTFFKKFAVGKAEPYGLKSNAKRCKRKLGKQGVLVPSGDRSGPVYVATSVGAGRLPLADSTRGGSRETAPPFPAAKTARLEGQNP